MAKKLAGSEMTEADFARDTIGHFNTYLLVRMFAASYQSVSRPEYLEAITKLCDGFVDTMKHVVQTDAQTMTQAGVDKMDVARQRLRRLDALEKADLYLRGYLTALRPQETEPAPEAPEGSQ